MVTCVEILGGILVFIGFFVAFASVPLIISMLVALFTLHIHYGFSAVNTIGLTRPDPCLDRPDTRLTCSILRG